MTLLEVLKSSAFGRRTAEEEYDLLHEYFVETEQWRRVFSGDVDIVYGPKGSGKSAIYSLIIRNEDVLFDKNVLVVPGENPQGAPAFKHLSEDAPSDEFEFISLWKLYMLTLCGQAIKDYGFKGNKCDTVVKALEDADLLPSTFSLAKALRYAFDYVKSLTRNVEAVETEMSVDAATSLPVLRNKIFLREPNSMAAKHGAVSVDELFETANAALKEHGFAIWILLDRLDVAFADKPNLESEALRALFKFYLDTKQYSQIRPKVFLRTDIWRNITREGFREASHIERSITIEWREEDILNLIVRRILANQKINEFYGISKEDIEKSSKEQDKFLYRTFPRQVESGPNKPTSFAWLLSRTSDAFKIPAPREIVHFLNELRDVQIARLERGERGPSEGRLFEQVAFKEALPAVSRVRLEQTLYAEFASAKPLIERLREQKATQNIDSLSVIWNTPENETANNIASLESIGFFERFGGSWRVPFLYRPALDLVQGAAD